MTEIVSHRVFGLSFGLYSSEEIKKLSVKEITNPQSFDTLAHCTHGGLYDPALGPTEFHDICVTCGQKAAHCPGHMGHISLPMPVYNPVLFITLIKMLRNSCFECHMMLCRSGVRLLVEKQMQVLDEGHLTAAGQLQDSYTQFVMSMGGKEDLSVLHDIEQHLDNVVKTYVPDGTSLGKKCVNIKHVNAHKQQILNEFLKGSMSNKSQCPHCRMPVRPLRAEQNSKVYFSKGLKRSAATKLVHRKYKEMRNSKDISSLDDTDIVEMEKDGETSPEILEKQIVALMDQAYLTPIQAKKHLRLVWQNDSQFLRHVMGALNFGHDRSDVPTDVFFIDIMPVHPPKFRPVAMMRGMKFDNPQTASLSKVVADCKIIKQILLLKKDKATEMLDSDVFKNLPGKTAEEKLYNAWLQLQIHVNSVIDSDLDKLNTERGQGIKQILEKKEGLFRKHMMGKRVNFAARSVISPDPFINTNEIGIPHVFAIALTYPEPVTPWNFKELKQAVLNGPLVHPGACFVEMEDGFTVRLSATDKLQREGIAKQLLTPSANAAGNAPNKKVLRHLRNGDVLLLNRQPTLHKPSIQAHRARVLPGEKTLRLHYANCKAYNADFDGDEMNAHFPQNEIGRAEAYTIASTDHNYLVPKDGAPLAGLIQDHMIGGVTLTMRGRFFARGDYHELVYSALTDKVGPVKTLPPAMIKPHVLWSGKQVLSTLLLNVIPEGMAPLNITGKAKISHKNWVNGMPRKWKAGGSPLGELDMTESEVVIRKGELLVGVLDKAHYGNTPYGLVHCCYELYGGGVAGRLLTALARLFTCFLQGRGFTLGVADILCTDTGNAGRRLAMAAGSTSGPQVAAKALGLKQYTDKKELVKKMREAHFERGGEGLKDLDLCMKGKTDDIGNAIVKQTMPIGLCKKFPDNNLQLMVQAGAKGSSVNCMQISCLLGQIELEGRRPPLMISGQNLPSFEAYDSSPRAGGFIDGRFLTGIRPQEYFFHCMAGREGLVDTAVKTSRSGYLQRCIVKHLEGIVVNYDMSVRDADGSVIQFNYGEDSLDILKTQFLRAKQFSFLINNKDAVISDKKIQDLFTKVDVKKAGKHFKKVRKWKKKMAAKDKHKVRMSDFVRFSEDMHDEAVKWATEMEDKLGRTAVTRKLCDSWREVDRSVHGSYQSYSEKCPDPVLSVLRADRHVGSITETLDQLIADYTNKNADELLCDDTKVESHKIGKDEFRTLMNVRYMEALAPPGEPVGLLAAQSIGEPSTQMTLNTFHFAGRGEMNVTLGIPRLREILMVASSNLGTPAMDIPVLPNIEALDAAPNLKLKLTKVLLNRILQDVEVTESLSGIDSRDKCRLYKVLFTFLPHEMYRDEFKINPSQVLRFMETTFFRQLQDAVNKKTLELTKTSLLTTAKVRVKQHFSAPAGGPTNGDDNDDVRDDDQHDGDATSERNRRRQEGDRDYDGEDEDKNEVEESDDSGAELEIDLEETTLEGTRVDETSMDDDTPMPGSPATPEPTPKKKKKRKSKREMDERRVTAVLSGVRMAEQYSYDADDELWCQLTIRMGLSDRKLDMTSLIEEVAKRTVVYQVPQINRAFLSENTKPGEEGTHLKTEGVNIHEMYKHDRVLDLNKLYANDIHAIADTYGIEAACKVIIKEMRDVFAAYGIDVDYHHLSLIADYMTVEGKYKAFNRMSIESNPSPLQKMSFETTMHFLKAATLLGAKDDLNSPSSRLVVGKVVAGGTGCFSLIQPLQKGTRSS